jgi:tRNA modification GTPase
VKRDTIFALSSGRPPAAIAVVRVSGPQAGDALRTLTGRLPQPRQAALARIRDPDSKDVIDEALVLWFPGPNSETGEDVAEMQIHGGRAVIAGTLAALTKLPGLRPAQAGEFTRQAFENGRMDLTAVEGLADLVAAETEAPRRQAVGQLRGFLGQRAETWRTRLIEALALVEAGIDFSEEDDVPREAVRQALAIAAPLIDEISTACAHSGERLREGLYVAVAGPPNAGKSTLFNRLARREAAIVSPFPGTTRDVLEVHLDLGGYPVTVVDTAGIRDAEDPVEREGVRRATEHAAVADLVLWVTEAGADAPNRCSYSSPALDLPTGKRLWRVLNKIDLLAEQENVGLSVQRRNADYLVSATTGIGVDHLIDAIRWFCTEFFPPEPALVTRERHRRELGQCVEALRAAQAAAGEGREELVAEHLRLATRTLGKLLGRVDVEDVLDVIFRDFCVGK